MYIFRYTEYYINVQSVRTSPSSVSVSSSTPTRRPRLRKAVSRLAFDIYEYLREMCMGAVRVNEDRVCLRGWGGDVRIRLVI